MEPDARLNAEDQDEQETQEARRRPSRQGFREISEKSFADRTTTRKTREETLEKEKGEEIADKFTGAALRAALVFYKLTIVLNPA